MGVIYIKGLRQFYFMRKLQKFGVDREMLVMFNCLFVESILTFCSVACIFHYLYLVRTNSGRLLKCQARSQALLRDGSHSLYGEYVLLPSGRRNTVPALWTSYAQMSFQCSSIEQISVREGLIDCVMSRFLF